MGGCISKTTAHARHPPIKVANLDAHHAYVKKMCRISQSERLYEYAAAAVVEIRRNLVLDIYESAPFSYAPNDTHVYVEFYITGDTNNVPQHTCDQILHEINRIFKKEGDELYAVGIEFFDILSIPERPSLGLARVNLEIGISTPDLDAL